MVNQAQLVPLKKVKIIAGSLRRKRSRRSRVRHVLGCSKVNGHPDVFSYRSRIFERLVADQLADPRVFHQRISFYSSSLPYGRRLQLLVRAALMIQRERSFPTVLSNFNVTMRLMALSQVIGLIHFAMPYHLCWQTPLLCDAVLAAQPHLISFRCHLFKKRFMFPKLCTVRGTYLTRTEWLRA